MRNLSANCTIHPRRFGMSKNLPGKQAGGTFSFQATLQP